MAALQTNQSNTTPTKPRAFINVLFFDEQFNTVDFKISMVGNNSVVKDHFTELQNLMATKSGYVYIYYSNESPVNVFFDNLQVVQTRGPILEETHYYPFGLTMSGISSKAAGSLENRKKFNDGTELQSKEFSDGSGLELYATDFRSYDPQLGRLWQIDPLAEVAYNISPYVFASNNPISINDPSGLKDSVREENSTPEKPKVLEEVIISNKPSGLNKTIDNANKWIGWGGLGYDVVENTIYKGDWVYKTSRGVVQTVWDTKWGANKNKELEILGNINNYSKNAQAAIRGTKVVKIVRTATGLLVYVGVALDVGKAVNGYLNNDPRAGEYARTAALNTGVVVLGASIPVVGWTITGVYFLGDALIPGGWEAAGKASQQNLENNRAIDPSWSARPMGGL